MALWLLHHLDPPQAGHAERVLDAAGAKVAHCHVSAGEPLPALDDADGLVVFGGHESVRDLDAHPHLRAEVRLLAEAVEREVPVLGICLGSQLLAHALGARVERLERRRIAYGTPAALPPAARDPLFAGAPLIPAPHWNEDGFGLPAGAVELQARTDAGVEAFRAGPAAWGVQYHPELDLPMLDTWYARWGDVLAEAGVTEADARRADARHADAQRAAAEHLFGAFARVAATRSARAPQAETAAVSAAGSSPSRSPAARADRGTSRSP